MVLPQHTTDSVMKWQNPIVFLMQTVAQPEWGWSGLSWNQLAKTFLHAVDQFSTVRKSTEGTVGRKTTSETRIHRNVYVQFISTGTRDKPFMKTLKLLPPKLWFVIFASVEVLRSPLFVFMTQEQSVKVKLVWLCCGRWNAIIIMCSSHASDCTACLARK